MFAAPADRALLEACPWVGDAARGTYAYAATDFRLALDDLGQAILAALPRWLRR